MAKKAKDTQYYEAVGRRKEAVALVRLYIVGKDKTVTVAGEKIEQGHMMVNNQPSGVYFPTKSDAKKHAFPLEVTSNMGRFAISVKVSGGGKEGQLDAVSLGISRALLLLPDTDHKPALNEYRLLTRDPRSRERRKVGTGGKARRQKQSPKR